MTYGTGCSPVSRRAEEGALAFGYRGLGRGNVSRDSGIEAYCPFVVEGHPIAGHLPIRVESLLSSYRASDSRVGPEIRTEGNKHTRGAELPVSKAKNWSGRCLTRHYNRARVRSVHFSTVLKTTYLLGSCGGRNSVPQSKQTPFYTPF